MFKNTCSFGLLAIALAAPQAACRPYRLDPPDGFVEVSSGAWETRMKALDNVGLRVRRFDNVRGGTLAFWSADLVKKLGERDYVLVDQTPVTSKNGVVGTRFDFDYTAPGSESKPKFYSLVLFVTDAYKFTLEVAGNKEYAANYLGRVNAIAAELKIRGCKPASKICHGPQPPRLQTPAPKSAEPAEPPSAGRAAPPEPTSAGPAAPAPVATPDAAAPPAGSK